VPEGGFALIRQLANCGGFSKFCRVVTVVQPAVHVCRLGNAAQSQNNAVVCQSAEVQYASRCVS